MSEQILTQCTVGGAVFVHVEDGVITRIRPIVFDETDPPTWTISARGREFSPFRKVGLNPYVVPERTRIYSENRIKYPLKRIDFDPNGQRNPQNRGKSGYERISWGLLAGFFNNSVLRFYLITVTAGKGGSGGLYIPGATTGSLALVIILICSKKL
jgi:anaerobic selenocysteine-containing dehydrogenase